MVVVALCSGCCCCCRDLFSNRAEPPQRVSNVWVMVAASLARCVREHTVIPVRDDASWHFLGLCAVEKMNQSVCGVCMLFLFVCLIVVCVSDCVCVCFCFCVWVCTLGDFGRAFVCMCACMCMHARVCVRVCLHPCSKGLHVVAE